jgi:hypothetical protein
VLRFHSNIFFLVAQLVQLCLGPSDKISNLVSSMTSTNKVRVLKSTEYIEWSIFPMRKWMQVIGISSAFKSSSGYCAFIVSYIYRVSIWFFSLMVNSILLYYPLYEYSNSKVESVTNWIEIINCVTKTLHTVGIHTVILFLFNNRWSRLIESLNETENRYGLKRINYRKVRQLSIAGVVYIFIMVNIL